MLKLLKVCKNDGEVSFYIEKAKFSNKFLKNYYGKGTKIIMKHDSIDFLISYIETIVVKDKLEKGFSFITDFAFFDKTKRSRFYAKLEKNKKEFYQKMENDRISYLERKKVNNC